MLHCCLILDSRTYVVFNLVLQLIVYTKEKNAILFTYPLTGSFTSTGLVVSSKLPRFSDLYTLTIESADPKSISANEPVHLTKSVTQWFTMDGVLVEGLFWKDVEALIAQYTKEPKKSKWYGVMNLVLQRAFMRINMYSDVVYISIHFKHLERKWVN